jgi:YHS domain-containing protein
VKILFYTAVSFAAIVFAQENGAPLKLVPSDPLTEPQYPKKAADKEHAVRPAILVLKPAGDPIYVEEDSKAGDWSTYRRPRVEPFSRDGHGNALQGYDVVSYFEQHAEKGLKEYSLEYAGFTWSFHTAEHRNKFRQDPEQFLPQYGGFCAYSVGRGYPATADPTSFAIVGGKLYLFFDKAVRFVWEQDLRSLIAGADRNWPKLHRTE